MAHTTSKSKGLLKDMPRRGFLAHMEYHKAFSAAFTEAFETYLTKHDISEKKGQWLKDLPDNASRATKAFHKSIYKTPQEVYHKYFEDEVKEEKK